MVFSLLAVVPAQAQTAPPGGNPDLAGAGPPLASQTFVYNIFATDSYVPLADGNYIYNYGFVGGRAGIPLTYARSVTPLNANTLPNFTYNGNGALPNGAPMPTAGPLTGDEIALQGNAQFPGPMIYASVGDIIEIRFKNLGVTNPLAPNDPHSIHLHGADVAAANDGVPETSVGAVPANLCADGTSAPAGQNCASPAQGAGNVIVYMFSPKVASTYMYHCHQEADIHVTMGMVGALVVYNPTDAAAVTGPGAGKGGNLFGWTYDRDFVLLETETDVRQHCSEEGSYDPTTGLCQYFVGGTLPGQTGPAGSAPWNPVDYDPQYWFLNGLSFPNTIHVGLPENNPGTGWNDWIAAHPGYDPFVTGSVSTRHTSRLITNGDKVLLRMINLGFETQPMHMHGYHGKVIGSDQRAWLWSNFPLLTSTGSGLEKNTLAIGSGESYEWLIDMGTQSASSTYANGSGGVNGSFPGGTQTRYDPASGLPQSNTQTGSPAIMSPDGNPYIAGPVVTGADGIPTMGQLFPFHNHDDYKATNNGVYPGGMFTFIMPTP